MLSNNAIMLLIGFIGAVVVVQRAEAYCRTETPSGFASSCNYGGVEFQSGDTYKAPAPHCEKCTCTDGVMECCGYGKNEGPAHIEGCTEVDNPDSCERHYVDAYNEDKGCPHYKHYTR